MFKDKFGRNIPIVRMKPVMRAENIRKAQIALDRAMSFGTKLEQERALYRLIQAQAVGYL